MRVSLAPPDAEDAIISVPDRALPCSIAKPLYFGPSTSVPQQSEGLPFRVIHSPPRIHSSASVTPFVSPRIFFREKASRKSSRASGVTVARSPCERLFAKDTSDLARRSLLSIFLRSETARRYHSAAVDQSPNGAWTGS